MKLNHVCYIITRHDDYRSFKSAQPMHHLKIKTTHDHKITSPLVHFQDFPLQFALWASFSGSDIETHWRGELIQIVSGTTLLMLLLFSRSRPGVHCVPSGCIHDAFASTVVHLFLCHAHSPGSGHTSKMHTNSFFISVFLQEPISLWKSVHSLLSVLCSVCRHGGGDDLHHWHVS